MHDAGSLNQPQTQRQRRLHKHQSERRLPPGQPQRIAALTEKRIIDSGMLIISRTFSGYSQTAPEP